jgi:hypothetical protein
VTQGSCRPPSRVLHSARLWRPRAKTLTCEGTALEGKAGVRGTGELQKDGLLGARRAACALAGGMSSARRDVRLSRCQPRPPSSEPDREPPCGRPGTPSPARGNSSARRRCAKCLAVRRALKATAPPESSASKDCMRSSRLQRRRAVPAPGHSASSQLVPARTRASTTRAPWLSMGFSHSMFMRVRSDSSKRPSLHNDGSHRCAELGFGRTAISRSPPLPAAPRVIPPALSLTLSGILVAVA